MQQAMGLLPGFSDLPDMDIKIIDEIKEEKYTRQTINFMVAENEIVPAYLYIPIHENKQEKYPAILALRETDLIGKKGVNGQEHNVNLAYTKELAHRGYVVIATDYSGFGDLKDYEVIAAIAPRTFFSNSSLNDSNFSVAGVKKGKAEVSEVYRLIGAKDKLEARYPESQHDVPPEVRFESYRFIDKILGFNPLT